MPVVEDANWVLNIVDDGVGFDVAKNNFAGLGQSSMRERAEAMGAKYEMMSAPDAGTRIRIVVLSKGE